MANTALKLERLQLELRLIAPVVGIGGTVENPIPKYDPEPTPQQLADVEAAIAAFDSSDEADAEYLANLNPERKALRDASDAAIARLDQIISFSGTPNANQIYAAVQDIARIEKHLVKRVRQID